jgi:hypothetical protein
VQGAEIHRLEIGVSDFGILRVYLAILPQASHAMFATKFEARKAWRPVPPPTHPSPTRDHPTGWRASRSVLLAMMSAGTGRPPNPCRMWGEEVDRPRFDLVQGCRVWGLGSGV